MAKKNTNSNKIVYIMAIVAIALVAVALVGKSKGWFGKPKGIAVEMGEVKTATIIEKVSASGAVQPVVEVKISPEVPGEIIELAIEEGDSVSKGDFLLKIRPDNFESALERQKAILNQQKANLAEAKAREARANASFVQAQLDFKRQKKLFDQKVISDADFEVAEANFKMAEQDLASAKESVKAADYSVQSSNASVKEALENLKLTNITAPMTGTVSKLDVELGETVVGTSQMQGTEMLRIADLANMEVRVDVNENDIIKISMGDTAIIDVDSYSYMDKRFKGVVTQIANSANTKASADAVTEFEVRIKILNESYQDLIKEKGLKYPFRPGMTASVDIITETMADVIAVPLSAVTTRKPDASDSVKTNKDELDEVVFVVKENQVYKTIVKTGISDFDNIQVLEGLELGEKIVTGPYLEVSKRLSNEDFISTGSEEGSEADSEK